jgi:hypothetical protein
MARHLSKPHLAMLYAVEGDAAPPTTLASSIGRHAMPGTESSHQDDKGGPACPA